jgi:hypothetical protein
MGAGHPPRLSGVDPVSFSAFGVEQGGVDLSVELFIVDGADPLMHFRMLGLKLGDRFLAESLLVHLAFWCPILTSQTDFSLSFLCQQHRQKPPWQASGIC